MSPAETRAPETIGGWTRISAGNYERDGWSIQKVRSDYGDVQWVVDNDNDNQPGWGQFDTLGEAKTAVDRATEIRALPANFDAPDPVEHNENSGYVHRIMSLPTDEDNPEGPVFFSVMADDAITNAYDSAVERGFATVREGAWKEQRIFEPVPPISELELERWVFRAAAKQLPGLLDSYGYDKNGELYDFNRRS